MPNYLPGAASHETFATDPRSHASQPGVAAVPVPEEPSGFAAVLRNRHFRRLWMAQIISQTIMNATNYGLITLIAKESRSLLSTGLAIVAFALPALLFGAPAGVVVDHFDRRRVLWLSNLLRAGATVAFIVSLKINSSELLPVYALTFLIAVIGQFFGPAEGAAIPRLVGRRQVIDALALFNITFTISQAAGLIVLGPLLLLLVPQFEIGYLGMSVTVMPIDSLLLVVAALYLVCVLLIVSIPHNKLDPNPGESAVRRAKLMQNGQRMSGVMRGIVESIQFILGDLRLTVVVFQLSLAGVVTSVIAMIAPTFVTKYFGQPPEAAALVFVPAGIGLVIGAAFTPNITRRLKYGKTVFIGILVLSLATLAITGSHALVEYLRQQGWSSDLMTWPFRGLVLVLTFIMGFALDFINVPAQAMMQDLTPDNLKGRVLAVQIMFFNGFTIPIVLVLGHLGDAYSLDYSMNVLGVSVFIVGLCSMIVWVFARLWHTARHPREANSSRPILYL